MGKIVLEFFMVLEIVSPAAGKKRKQVGIDFIGIVTYYILYVVLLPVQGRMFINPEFLMHERISSLYAVFPDHYPPLALFVLTGRNAELALEYR